MSRTYKDKSWKYWPKDEWSKINKVCHGCPYCHKGIYAKDFVRRERHTSKRNILNQNWELT